MGVQNLWLLLTPAAQKIPESQLASKRLAIDVSIWVIHILHGSLSLGSSSFENIHLLAIFKRLIKLLSLGIKPVFVFDGKVPNLKKRTVAERAGSRKINIRKVAEKLIVKQLEGKKIAKVCLNKEEASENEEMEYEEEDIEQPKDVLQIFEEEVEKEGIKTLLHENKMSFEEFEKMDYVRQRALIRDLKQRALEKKQEKLKNIENKAEFSKIQMQEYLKMVEKKKEIEGRKKELGEKVNQEIVNENMQKIQEVGGLQAGAKIQISKDFLVIKKQQDPEIERLRNLMGKIQKPERRYKKDKLKECSEKLNKLIESKEIEPEKKNGSEKQEDNKNAKPENGTQNMFIDKLKDEFEGIGENKIGKMENPSIVEQITKKEKQNLNIESSNLIKITGDSNEENKQNEIKKENYDNKKTIESPKKTPQNADGEFMRPLDKVKNEKEAVQIDLKKIESLRKEFHEEEVRRMVSCHQSRSSSKSSKQKNPTIILSQAKITQEISENSNFNTTAPDENSNMQKSHHSLTQEEILKEIEKMDSLNPNEETCDPEMTDDFLRLSNLNSLGDSLTTKFEQIKNLLQLFGVPWVESPFEAEAQCAYLEMRGLVDGIITEDSDVFLFGGRKVYRKLFAGNSNQVDFYDIRKIEKELGLNREKLISTALFLGSDYTIGVKGVGIVNAMEIVNAFETIESLERFKAWAEKPDILLEDCQNFYRNIPLKELQYKHFHKNYKNNWEFPDDFPNSEVVDAYQNPAVDDSLEPFLWNEPDIESLKEFCRDVFEWGPDRIDEAGFELAKIIKKMRENNGQKKIEDYFSEKMMGVVKSKRLQAAIKGMRPEEEKEEEEEEELRREIEQLEDLNMFKFKRVKESE